MISESNKKKASRFFTTVADMGSLFMALVYVSYVGILLALGIGHLWLNYAMLIITIIYVSFFLFKIFYLNTLNPNKALRKAVRISYRYTKLSMRFINAVFVALSLINMQFSEKHVVALIGIIIVGVSFAIAILWDVGMYFIRKKVKSLRDSWNQLTADEKKERIEMFITGFIRSLDNISGLDEYIEAGISASKRVGKKLKKEPKILEENAKEKEEITEK